MMPGSHPGGEEFEGDYGEEEGDLEDMDDDTLLLMELVQDPNFQVLKERLIENPGFYGELMENL
tara:strand:- start:271 stop:462 length:192 start_codon:yes stop_codon:yes gene_type:complete